jgi:hypothetical protein
VAKPEGKGENILDKLHHIFIVNLYNKAPQLHGNLKKVRFPKPFSGTNLPSGGKRLIWLRPTEANDGRWAVTKGV